jgi:hypothetical protein
VQSARGLRAALISRPARMRCVLIFTRHLHKTRFCGRRFSPSCQFQTALTRIARVKLASCAARKQCDLAYFGSIGR